MKETFHDIIKGDKPVLVDFYATWCGPCKAQAPILDDVAKTMGDDSRIIKIDVDKNPQVAAAYGVRGVPTLIIFKKGEIKWKTSGVHSATQLVQQLRSV